MKTHFQAQGSGNCKCHVRWVCSEAGIAITAPGVVYTMSSVGYPAVLLGIGCRAYGLAGNQGDVVLRWHGTACRAMFSLGPWHP